jgi:uncharacterized membrane protein
VIFRWKNAGLDFVIQAMAESAQNVSPRKRPWGLTLISLAAVGGLISMPILAGPPGDEEMPDLIRFFGHFHPVVLHLPIGVFTLILFQELGAIFFRPGRNAAGNSLFPLFFGAASSILAVIAGFLLYQGHSADYSGNDLAERHLWGGLVFAVGAVLTFLLKAWTLALGANPAWYRSLLFASVAVMGFTSHDGASMTHGSDYLTRYAPDPLRRILGMGPRKEGGATVKEAAAPVDPVVYADIVAPIFERRCVECHKEGKSKGRLRMDTFELLLAGGKEGPSIEPGSAAESNIIIRIELPEDDEEHMPPEGKPDLDPDELLLVKWWLDSGADPQKTLSAHGELPAGVQDAVSKLVSLAPVPAGLGEKEDETEPPADDSTGLDAKLKEAVSALTKEFPGALSFESQQSPLVTFTAVSLRGTLDDEGFAKLAPVLPQLVTLDLSATRITDQSVAALEGATQLRQIRLAETAVTDAAIDTLLKLPALESINLYGTQVSDAGIRKLAEMAGLKRLYLWQTPVTEETLKLLKEKLPQCEIVTGI